MNPMNFQILMELLPRMKYPIYIGKMKNMSQLKRPLILASQSPYRRELLGRLNLTFDAVSHLLDEQVVFARSLPLIWAAVIWACGSALLVLRGAALIKVGRLVAKAR